MFLKNLVIVALSFTLTWGSQVPFAVKQRAIDDNLRSYISELMEKWSAPGFSLGIVRPDGEIEMEGFGISNESGDPVTPQVSCNHSTFDFIPTFSPDTI